MYVPKLFRLDDWPTIRQFIHQNSFAVLISHHEGKPWGTHLPLEITVNESGEKVLWGHLSRANPQWRSFESNPLVMAIFQGPHSYVSSSWYNHLNVPTWNYIAVHIYGTVKIMEEEKLYESLKLLVNRYEKVAKNPMDVETMPQEFVRREMKGIVGMEIAIEKIEGKWKLSQNRGDEDYRNIIQELEQLSDLNSKLVAGEMKKMRTD